jgi:hypothetical protein
MNFNPTEIENLAALNGWKLLKQPNNFMLRFKKGACMLDVWYTRMTVGTYLNHPKQGKTQLFKRNVSLKLLDKLFKNPRLHTRKGYHQKYNYRKIKP